MGEWRRLNLVEAIELQRGFDLPESQRRNGGVPVVASTSIVGWHDEARVAGPGVVIGRSGSIGGGWWVEDDFWPLNTTLWVKNFRENDRRFIYYLLRSIDFSRFNAGSGVPTLNRNHLTSVDVLLPPLAEQRAIVGVLGALDDKIESNRRISATARSLCDAVFEADTDTEERLSAVSVVTMGSSPPGDTYNSRGDGLPFYQGVTDFGFLSPSRRVWTSNPIRIAEAGSTLISVRAPVGKLNEASEKCCIGRGVASASSENQTVLYYALRKADAVWAPFESEGTVFGSINRSDLEGAKIPWISGSKIDQVEADLRAIHGRVRAAVAEIVTLEQVRDALLPELLSGRLRVPDAEKVVEGAL